MNRKVLITGLVLLLTCCVAAGIFAFVGGFAFLRNGGLLDRSGVEQAIPTLASELATGTPVPENLPEVIPSSSAEVPSTGSQSSTQTAAPLPADIQSQMDEIQGQVSQIRGLSMDQPINRAVLTPDQLREHVINDLLKDYTPDDMQKDQALLSIMGLLDPNFDLKTMYVNLLSEQIAGFYDDQTKSMYVVQGQSFQGPERMTYAHEYTHALQDHTFGLRDGMNVREEYCKDHSEYCSAAKALIEGDASLTEQLWLYSDSTPQDRQQIQEFYQNYSSPVYDAAPEFMKQDFQFPYLQGLDFVQSLYQKGGFQAVDAAFQNPPQTTEQIMHPDRYPNDQPVTVNLPDMANLLGSGWNEVDQNVLGEWSTYLVLKTGRDPNFRMDDANAKKAAEGWGGDEYAVYQSDSGQVVLVLRTAWDTQADANEFASIFGRYGSRRWGNPSSTSGGRYTWDNTSDGSVVFQQNGQETIWVIAPDAATVDKILSAIGGSQA